MSFNLAVSLNVAMTLILATSFNVAARSNNGMSVNNDMSNVNRWPLLHPGSKSRPWFLVWTQGSTLTQASTLAQDLLNSSTRQRLLFFAAENHVGDIWPPIAAAPLKESLDFIREQDKYVIGSFFGSSFDGFVEITVLRDVTELESPNLVVSQASRILILADQMNHQCLHPQKEIRLKNRRLIQISTAGSQESHIGNSGKYEDYSDGLQDRFQHGREVFH